MAMLWVGCEVITAGPSLLSFAGTLMNAGLSLAPTP